MSNTCLENNSQKINLILRALLSMGFYKFPTFRSHWMLIQEPTVHFYLWNCFWSQANYFIFLLSLFVPPSSPIPFVYLIGSKECSCKSKAFPGKGIAEGGNPWFHSLYPGLFLPFILNINWLQRRNNSSSSAHSMIPLPHPSPPKGVQ